MGADVKAMALARSDGDYREPLNLVKKVLLVTFMVFYRIMSIIYHVFYFYFAPFIVSFLVILVGADIQFFEEHATVAGSAVPEI